jgi:hypothetical protein
MYANFILKLGIGLLNKSENKTLVNWRHMAVVSERKTL